MQIATTTLGQFDGRRDNNFTAIRILFAWLVLYGHSYAVQNSAGVRDPLNLIFEGSIWIGALSVNGFFAISGFLVAASFIRRGVVDYTLSRVLRIYPALIVCVLVTVFILGPFATQLSLASYFSTSDTYEYLRNMLAFQSMKYSLPGVFQDNVRDAVNGSLWSLTIELRCYFLLALAGVVGLMKSQLRLNATIVVLLIAGFFFYSDFPLIGKNEKWARPAMYFLVGVCFYANRDRIFLNLPLAAVCAVISYVSFGEDWFTYVFPWTFGYLVFYLAYCTRYLNIDDKVGDLSYGLYIYAWPTQQLTAMLWPSLGHIGNILIASTGTITLAYLSWHYLEKPALALKARLLSGQSRTAFKRFALAFRRN